MKKGGKLVARSRLRWALSATRSLWPAAPYPAIIIQLAGVNEGWDEMHWKRRLMKNYSSPPIIMIPLLFPILLGSNGFLCHPHWYVENSIGTVRCSNMLYTSPHP